jgi:2-dehydro-3-deoxyphosphogluconate aldolase/(4S)-4-hydroxy-2-oxoglutarate aldolase
VTRAVSIVLGFELRHIGINMPDSQSAQDLTSRISDILRLPIREGDTSMFVGMQFEILKKTYLGAHGHIALGTNFIDRALAYFARHGIKVIDETRNEKDGKLLTIYLDIDVGGFALHLVQL